VADEPGSSGAEPQPSLYLEVDTFAPLLERGGSLVALFERVRADVIEPALASTSVPLKPTFSLSPPRGSSSREYVYSDKIWDLLLTRIAAGEVGEFQFDLVGSVEADEWKAFQRRLEAAVESSIESGSGDEIDDALAQSTLGRRRIEGVSFGLHARQRSEYTPDWAFTFALRSDLPSVGGELTPEVQRCWCELGKEAAVALHAATGYLTLDHVDGVVNSPYERRFLFDPGSGLARARECVRGYFWGNFLGAEQIKRLGGFETVRGAPCQVIERISRDPEIAYLQLSADLRTYSDEQLRRLRDFLQPVLRVEKPDPYYMGPPVRVLVDEGPG